jgi:hypothetical protein
MIISTQWSTRTTQLNAELIMANIILTTDLRYISRDYAILFSEKYMTASDGGSGPCLELLMTNTLVGAAIFLFPQVSRALASGPFVSPERKKAPSEEEGLLNMINSKGTMR